MPRSFRRRHSKKPLLTPPCTIVPRVLLQRCKLPKPGRSQRCQPISFPAVSPHDPPTVPWRSCRSERRRCSRSVSCMPSTQRLLVQATVDGSRGGQDRRVFDITILHLVLLSFQLFDPINHVMNTDDTESTCPGREQDDGREHRHLGCGAEALPHGRGCGLAWLLFPITAAARGQPWKTTAPGFAWRASCTQPPHNLQVPGSGVSLIACGSGDQRRMQTSSHFVPTGSQREASGMVHGGTQALRTGAARTPTCSSASCAKWARRAAVCTVRDLMSACCKAPSQIPRAKTRTETGQGYVRFRAPQMRRPQDSSPVRMQRNRPHRARAATPSVKRSRIDACHGAARTPVRPFATRQRHESSHMRVPRCSASGCCGRVYWRQQTRA